MPRASVPDSSRRATRRPWATTEVAAWTGMSTDFVLDEIRSGDLRAARFGRHYRIAFGEVLRYLRDKGFTLPLGDTPRSPDPLQTPDRTPSLTRR